MIAAGSVCFFTVCGGGVDYEFLLGSIEHHAAMGRHVVLDTTPAPEARTFGHLPSTVRWIHEPIYGRGWKEFRLRSAVERAVALARESGAEILAYLDCDEFFSRDIQSWVLPLARIRMVEVKTVTWMRDGSSRDMGESEWHRRLWPARMPVSIVRNEAWIGHPMYNGNPEHHPYAQPENLASVVRAHGQFHHHMHYALGGKADDTETADTTIAGWRSGGIEVPRQEWPAPLQLWKMRGVLPSSRFAQTMRLAEVTA